MLGHGKAGFRVLGVLAATVVACAAFAVLVGPGCTLTSNDAPPDASPIDAPFQHPTVCTACSIQQCTGQLAVCLQSADCSGMLTCANGGGGAQGCFCGGAAPGQNAFRALAACNEVSACGSCAAQCKDTVDAAVCASPGAPLSTDRCAALDAGAPDASDDAAQAIDAGDDGAVVDAGDDGSSIADAAIAEAGPSDAGVDAPSLGGCSPCVEASCADPKRACGVGSECDLFLQCAAACAGAACVDVCGKLHVSGKTAAAALASCALSNCSTACGL